jgi:type II secretory pathway pseudopilin PulG
VLCQHANDHQRGATLLLLLVMVVIMGLAAGMAGQSWRSTMQRAREAELLWRGQQYQKAIASYYSVRQGQQMLPTKLEDLVRDPRFPHVVRHLRKLYKDPMTGEDWELVTDSSKQVIVGVRSKSDLEPFRKDGFPKSLDKLKGKEAYNEWEFVFELSKQKQVRKMPVTTSTKQ